MAIKTSADLVAVAKLAAKCKTIYVKGCWGAPMTEQNKIRWLNAYSYNRRWDRKAKIQAATNDTFGFDCVCFIKGLLWGWNADAKRMYGGAGYAVNDVPDIAEDAMIAACKDVYTDFFTIQPGEVVYMPGHIGIYIGDGLVIEASPAWADGVQTTALLNIGKKTGYKGRTWVKHGKLPYIDYPAPEEKPAFTVKQWQQAAIADGFAFPKYGPDGTWGAECASVATKAVCKRRVFYTYPNLTRLVQKAVGVTVDGKFGAKTKAAVISYQQRHGLTPDGEVGINTYKMMMGIK
ncbi:MAG: peptidoglycan-binding protein [Oscillospiraceae bacterium]|nr:peptidoglycan-binding protein [Oscillospiraceae bacterium]